jgi:hypothetical protein
MKSSTVLLALLAGTILAGCSGIDVATDYNQEWNFSSYRTYDWVAIKSPSLRDPLLESPLLDNRVRFAVDRELGIKGFERSEQDPDFLISFHVGTKSQVDVATCGYHYPTSPHCWGGEVEGYAYSEGTLVLDFIDSAEEELVWRGTAKGALYDDDDAQEVLNRAVVKVLEDFPPR